MISKDVLMDPALFILRLYLSGHRYSQNEHILIDMCLLHAKKNLLHSFEKE